MKQLLDDLALEAIAVLAWPAIPFWWLFAALRDTLILFGASIDDAFHLAWPLAALASWIETPNFFLRMWWLGYERDPGNGWRRRIQ